MQCSHWLAVGGAVDAVGVQQVEATARVQAAAALPAVTQATGVVVLHQRLARPQNAALAQHTHRLAHWKHTHTQRKFMDQSGVWLLILPVKGCPCTFFFHVTIFVLFQILYIDYFLLDIMHYLWTNFQFNHYAYIFICLSNNLLDFCIM